MPRCESCGNSSVLASTLTSRQTETANPPPYGLLANFDQEGRITTMECQGSSLDEAQAAFEDPPAFFNTCPVCGSGSINWQN
ncbi:MAG: hypothetical protein K6T66_00015 [Peptococcaceae bacterium]|nr:hypothetical protein [Peptococcaceae bacterium]